MSNWQVKPTQEGCGKWLTARAKTNHKRPTKKDKTKKTKPLNFTVANTCHPPLSNSKKVSRTLTSDSVIQNKQCPMKQSKINKFLVNKPKHSQCHGTSKLTHSTTKAPIITFPMKRDISVAQNEYDELWGSEEESEADDNCESHLECETKQIMYNNKKTCLETSKETTTSNNLSNDSCSKNSYHDGSKDIRLPLSKKLKKMDDEENNLFKLQSTFSQQNEVQLTQWLQGEVEEFCRQSKCEINKTKLTREILGSVTFNNLSPLRQNKKSYSPAQNKKSHSPEKSMLLCQVQQFSEWFNQHIETISTGCIKKGEDSNELDENNCKHCSPESYQRQRFVFSQWFEETLETFLKSHNVESCKTGNNSGIQ